MLEFHTLYTVLNLLAPTLFLIFWIRFVCNIDFLFYLIMEVASLSQNIEEYFDKRNCLASDLNYYEILELDSRCTKEDIRRSYYHFARIFHPDKYPKIYQIL